MTYIFLIFFLLSHLFRLAIYISIIIYITDVNSYFVYTFLDRENFAGKIILPFCTHEGSGLSGTDRTIAETTKADVKDGFALAGHIAQHSPDEARSALYEWMEKQGD